MPCLSVWSLAEYLLWFGRMLLPILAVISTSGHASLPAPYWIYWCALTMAVAIEFCILLWAPEFLQHVVGCRCTAAAAAVFGLGMLTGRTAARSPSSRHCGPATLSAGPAGHLSRLPHLWGTPAAINGPCGAFCARPRGGATLSAHPRFGHGSRGAHEPTPPARASLAGALGILVTPALLGGLADKVGLRLAHLIVPGLAVVALICFATAQALQRQAVLNSLASTFGRLFETSQIRRTSCIH